MKGKMALVLFSLLLLAAPVFAEITASGEFVFGFNESGDVSEEVFDTADLIFTGISADGFASVTMGLDLTTLDNTPKDGADKLSTDVIDALYLDLDMTGAMGLDTPVDVSFKAGRTKYEPEGYLGDVRNYTVNDVIDVETVKKSYVGLDLGVMDMVNVVFGLDPDMADDLRNMFVGVNGSFGMVKAEAFYSYVDDEYYTGKDFSGNYTSYGADFTVTLDILTFGAGLEYNDKTEETSYGAGVRSGILPATEMGISFASCTDTDVRPMEMGIDANYAVTEEFKVYGGLLLKDLENLDEDDMVGFELSASYTFMEDVTLYAGYVTKGSALNAQGDVKDDSFFMAVSAVF